MTKYGWFAYAPYTGDRFGGPLDASVSTSPAFGALSTVAIGGLTLVDPRKLGLWTRSAYRLADAVVSGVYTSLTLPADLPLTGEQRSAAGLAVGGLVLGLADLTEALDARAADWLSARGLRHPRWVIAGAAAAAVLAGYAWDRAEKGRVQDAVDAALDTSDDLGELSPEILQVLEALLVDGVPGVEALRRQLNSVQERVQGDGFSSEAWLAVAEDAPRISPRTQVWPVTGRFQWGGTWFEAQLQIHEGRLESLSLATADDQAGGEPDWETAFGLLDRWPRVDELEIVVESADPVP